MPLIDANIFLEVELKQKRIRECRSYLEKVRDGTVTAITTNFIVDTISILMDNSGCEPEQVRRFILSLLKYKGLSVYDLTLSDRVIATQYMERHKLDFDDATACAAVVALGEREIVSMDKHFDRVEGIQRIEP